MRLERAEAALAAGEPGPTAPRPLPFSVTRLEVVDGAAERGPLRVERLSLEGRVERDHLEVIRFSASYEGLDCSGSGEARLAPPRAQLRLGCAPRGSDAGTISGTVTVRGDGTWGLSARAARVDWASGLRVSAPPFGRLDAALSASGTFGPEGPVMSSASVAASASGGLSLRGSASGAWPATEWTLAARTGHVRVASASWASARLEALGVGPRARAAEARADGLILGELPAAAQASLRLAGDPVRHDVSVAAEWAQGARLRAEGIGSWDASVWSVLWRRLDGAARGLSAAAEGAFRTSASTRAVSVSGLRLSVDGAGLSLDAERRGRRWERLDASLSGLDAERWGREGLWPWPLRGKVSATASLRGPTQAPSGSLVLSVTGASWDGRAAGGLRLAARLTPERLEIDDALWRLPEGDVRLSGSMPARLGGVPDFDLRARAEGLDLVRLSPRGVALSTAALSFDLRARRIGGEASVGGALSLSAGALAVEEAGLALSGVRLELAAQDDELRVTAFEASPRPGSGPRPPLHKRLASALGLARTKEEPPLLEVTGAVRIDGPRLELLARRWPLAGPWGEARADAELRLEGTWAAPLASGRALVHAAELRPPPEEAGRPRATEDPGRLRVDARMELGRDVWFRDGESAIELKGRVDAAKEPYEPLRLVGAIESVRGSYAYAGKTFDLLRARLRFGGEAPPAPRVEAQARYAEPRTRAQVDLRIDGPPDALRLELSSVPPLDTSDIIALLVLGRLPESGADPQRRAPAGSDAAAQYLSGYLGRRVQRRLLRPLDLDVLRVRGAGPRQAELEVGRYVGRDLFVTYGQRFGAEGERKVSAEYKVSPRVSLEGRSSSTGKHVLDLIFTLGFR